MDEAAVNVLGVDNAATRSAQCDRLVAIKGKRDGTAVAAVLDEIRAAAKFEFSAGETTVPAEQNLLGLAVKASRLRATVGEISDAMRDVWGNHAPSNAVVQGAYSASYNASTQKNAKDEYAALLAKINGFAEGEGRRPRILVAKMGQDGHDRGAKVQNLTMVRLTPCGYALAAMLPFSHLCSLQPLLRGPARL